jgi:hypothetical protein
MDSIRGEIDTFSTTFTSDQFAPLDDQPSKNTSRAQYDTASPESNHAGSRTSQSPNSQSQANTQLSPRLNPRSCVTCRKRKVRCDKTDPCTNCQKAGIECIFPQPGRAPRRSKKPADAELLARLRRLEGVVQKLGKGVDGDDTASGEKSPDGRKNSAGGGNEANSGLHKSSCTDTQQSAFELNAGRRNSTPLWTTESNNQSTAAERLDRFQQYTTYKNRESGRLVVGEGRSRYVSNSFWAGLTEEV